MKIQYGDNLVALAEICVIGLLSDVSYNSQLEFTVLLCITLLH